MEESAPDPGVSAPRGTGQRVDRIGIWTFERGSAVCCLLALFGPRPLCQQLLMCDSSQAAIRIRFILIRLLSECLPCGRHFARLSYIVIPLNFC